MAQFCKNCGNAITDGNKFCSVCGTPVTTQVSQPQAPNQNYQQPSQTQQYQQYTQPNRQFNQPQYNQPINQQYYGQNAQPPKKSNAGLIIAIIAIALAVIIGLTVAIIAIRSLLKKGGNNTDTDSDIIIGFDSDSETANDTDANSGKSDKSTTKSTTTTTSTTSTSTTTTTQKSTTTTTTKSTTKTTVPTAQIPIEKIVGSYILNGTTTWVDNTDHTYDFSDNYTANLTFEDMTSNNLAMYSEGVLTATGVYDPKTGTCDMTDKEDGSVYHVTFYLDGSISLTWDEYYEDGHSYGSYIGTSQPQ